MTPDVLQFHFAANDDGSVTFSMYMDGKVTTCMECAGWEAALEMHREQVNSGFRIANAAQGADA
jgi:hypothetical protein